VIAGAESTDIQSRARHLSGGKSADDSQRGPSGAARRIAGNTALLVGADSFSKLALLFLYAVMARELGKAGFGVFTLAVSAALFVEFAGLGIDLILSREVARERHRVHSLFWNSVVIKLLLGVPTVIGVTAFGVLAGYSGSAELTIALIAISKLVDVLSQSFAATFRGHEEMRPPAAALTLQRLLCAMVGSYALIKLGAGVAAVGVIYLMASLAALTLLWQRLHSRGMRPRFALSGETGRWLAAAALPAGIATFFGAALARVDALILSLMTNDPTVGLYGAAYRLFDGTLFLTWGLGLAVFPLLSRLDRSTSPTIGTALELACKAVIAMLLPLGLALALFGPLIVQIVYGDAYQGAAATAQILGGATFLYGVFALPALTVAARDKQKWILWISGPALLINIALNVALIPSLSLNGAAVAMTITQLIMTVAMLGAAISITGSISASRMALGPGAGAVAMALSALIVGTGGVGLLTGFVAYVVVLLFMERLFHHRDFLLLRSVFSFQQSGRMPDAEPEGSRA
jgi:O-antigen/teichoic acid export membrane protein